MEAQRKAVTEFMTRGTYELVGEFTEVESGRKNNRPELVAAFDLCRKHKATLLIAKLDRLGRNVAFISRLMESNVDFICCDNPHANRLIPRSCAC